MKTKTNKDLQQRIQEVLSDNYKENKDFHKKNASEIYEEINIYHQELEFQNWELMRIRDQLEMGKKHFQTLYYDAPVGYVTYDSDYNISSANHSFSKMLGIETNELPGRKMTEFIHPDSQDFFWFHQTKLQKEGLSNSCEIELYYENRSVWTRIDSNLFTEDDKQQIRTILIDISAEKLHKQLLNKQHKLTLRINHSIGVEDLLLTGLTAALELTAMDAGAIFKYDSKQEALILSHQFGLNGQHMQNIRHLDVQNPQFRVIMNQEIVYAEEKAISSRKIDDPALRDIKSYIILPLIQAHDVIGALMLFDRQKGRLEPEKRKALETLTSVIAQTLSRELTLEQLQQSEQKYRSLFQNTAIGIFRTLSDGEALHINPAMAKILNIPANINPIKAFNELMKNVFIDPKRQNDFFQLLKKNEHVSQFELEARSYSGENIWLSLTARISEHYEDGSFVIDGFVTDISKRKSAEKAYQREKNLAQQYLDVAQIMLLSLDTEERVSSINPKGCEILGCSREEIIGKNWFDHFIVSDDLEKVKSVYHQLLREASESLNYYENLIRRKDGGTRLIAWHNSYLRNDAKEIIGFFSSGEDITERRAAEIAVAESERNFRLLFENSPLGTYIADLDGNILDGNPALLEILDSPSLEASKKINVLTFPPLIENGYAAIFRECLRDGEIKAIELPYQSKWGKSRFLSNYIVPLKNKQGDVEKIYTIILDITAQKEAEKKLQESEERSRAIVEAIPDIMFRISADGHFIDCHTPDEALLLMPCKAIIGKNMKAIMPPNLYELTKEKMAKVIATGTLQNYDYALHINNELHHFDARMVSARENEVLVIVRDITEMRQAINALAENEARLRALINSTPDIICFKDGEGRWLVANEADLNLFQLNGVNYRGKTNKELAEYSPFYRDALRYCEQTDELAWQNEDPSRSEEIVPLPDGSTKTYDVVKVPLFEDDGARKGLIVYGRDLTDRIQAEIAIRESEEKFRRIFESIDDIYYMADAEGIIKIVSPSATALSGYQPDELIGQSVTKLYHNPDDRKALLSQLHKTGFLKDYEVVLKKKNGEALTCSLTARVIYNNDKEAVGISGILRDITERKNTEAEHDRLVQQLHHSQKMESVGRLAGGVAHDFNNMLQGILGYSEMALEKLEANSPIKDYLAEIQKTAERSANLTRQLLAFARRQNVKPLLLDLNVTVSSMMNMLLRIVGEDINLQWLPNSDLKNVKMDPSQIDQILANLVVNARDAIINENGFIKIHTENITISEADAAEIPNAPEAGDYVLLTISDNGKGMDENTIKMIFEPFFTTKGVGEGTGLGLATVYGIVQQNGGLIQVESKLNEGTLFKIYLPAYDKPVEEMPETEKEGTLSLEGKETILMVEDEEVILETGKFLLEDLGYTVLTAMSPMKAIEKSEKFKGHIDLLITDIVMPKMNGRELAEKIQSQRPGVKVLFMSGYTADVIAAKGILDSNLAFIEKPFSIVALDRMVRKLLA
jgi:PAS domain S-box-containing protein